MGTRRYLSGVLVQVLGSRCEDPRDVIYGLQALLHPDSQQQVDYAAPTPRVFDEACAILLAEYLSNTISKTGSKEMVSLIDRLHTEMQLDEEDDSWDLRHNALMLHSVLEIAHSYPEYYDARFKATIESFEGKKAWALQLLSPQNAVLKELYRISPDVLAKQDLDYEVHQQRFDFLMSMKFDTAIIPRS